VNLVIENGLFGLLGPNGAGKTTLMRILVTLLDPTAGNVTIDGMDLQKSRKDIRKLIGYLPQDFSIFSKLKTWEFLDYIAALGGIKKRSVRLDRVDALLESVGLFNARDRMAGKLSGGMKRRLGIAQTLITDPRIMIVDEPTVGLDPEERLRFRSIITDLSQRDMIIILSTHIVGDISSTCRDMALLNHGRLVFSGPPQNFIAQARGKVFVISASHFELEELKEKYPVISNIPSAQGYEVRFVGDENTVPGATVVDPNLEDAYLSFMESQGELKEIA